MEMPRVVAYVSGAGTWYVPGAPSRSTRYQVQVPVPPGMIHLALTRTRDMLDVDGQAGSKRHLFIYVQNTPLCPKMLLFFLCKKKGFVPDGTRSIRTSRTSPCLHLPEPPALGLRHEFMRR